MTTSTSTTCAPTAITPADVHGMFIPPVALSTEYVDLGALLEESTSNQSTTPVFCDTYLKAIDSSTELVASQKMDDYVIDINIYRYVLKNYIIQLRDEFLNYSNHILNNHIFHYKKRKANIMELSTYKNIDKYKLLKLHNSNLYNKLITHLHTTHDNAMLISKLLVTTEII